MTIDVPVWLPVRRVRATRYGNRIGLGVMLAGVFMTAIDNSIVNVAIPSIRTTTGATFAEAELVVAGYNFTFGIGLMTGGCRGDIFGHRSMFLAGFVALKLTSALCGLALVRTRLSFLSTSSWAFAVRSGCRLSIVYCPEWRARLPAVRHR